MRKDIKYIGFYDLQDSKYKRNTCLSAINKMNYICDTMVKNNYNVTIVSPAWYVDKKAPKTLKQVTQISENVKLIQAPSFATKNKITGKLKYYFVQIWLFLYLITNIKKEEEIVVYHSLALMYPLLLAKKIKKFRVIYEVEEIYTDVIDYGKSKRKIEFKTISNADKYIFPTELLNKKLNKYNKPNVIIYGTYQYKDIKNIKFNDKKIHIVYAGTFNGKKGGVTIAINTAKFLDENYHVHIIGFGSDKEIQDVKELINKISNQSKCTVTYDGMYTGEDYIKFLQSCDIGLSTQAPNEEYNNTSFPSKVLSYMENGLRVVSVKIDVLEQSEISNLLYYYEFADPQNIAEAIMKIDYNDKYNSREIISKLDKRFTINLNKLLEI